jgi:hypothetical protein
MGFLALTGPFHHHLGTEAVDDRHLGPVYIGKDRSLVTTLPLTASTSSRSNHDRPVRSNSLIGPRTTKVERVVPINTPRLALSTSDG